MKNEPTEKLNASAIVHSIRATPAPLWLLQKDDTGVLYLSFLISTLVHVILFFIMVATRIFHPFAGTSKQFDLVWLSPVTTQGTNEPKKAGEPAPTREHVPKTATTLKTVAAPKKPPAAEPVPNQAPKSEPAPQKEPPKPALVPVAAPPETPEVGRVGEEMVITRYGGKVAEILERKTEAPIFKTFSSYQLKSSGGKADSRVIVEKKAPPPAPVRVAKAAEGGGLKKAPADVEKEKRDAPVIAASSVSTPSAPPATLPPRHFQGMYSLSAAQSRPAQGAKVAAETGTAKEPSRVKAAGAPGVSEAVKPSKTAGGNGDAAPTGNPASAKPAPPVTAQLPAVREPSVESRKEKPQAPPTEKPQAIFHPPLAGDLKLVITGDGELKVEASFREFRKVRRGKALFRWEDRSRKNIVPKAVRTGENTREAVIEITEEGIYDLRVTSADGRPVEAVFILKIRESGQGTVTKRLGRKSVLQTVTIARVLMPEGILWDDDSSFTGSMEDDASITKFDAQTGLIWREFK